MTTLEEKLSQNGRESYVQTFAKNNLSKNPNWVPRPKSKLSDDFEKLKIKYGGKWMDVDIKSIYAKERRNIFNAKRRATHIKNRKLLDKNYQKPQPTTKEEREQNKRDSCVRSEARKHYKIDKNWVPKSQRMCDDIERLKKRDGDKWYQLKREKGIPIPKQFTPEQKKKERVRRDNERKRKLKDKINAVKPQIKKLTKEEKMEKNREKLKKYHSERKLYENIKSKPPRMSREEKNKRRRERQREKKLKADPNWKPREILSPEERKKRSRESSKRWRKSDREKNPEKYREMKKRNNQILQIKRLDPEFDKKFKKKLSDYAKSRPRKRNGEINGPCFKPLVLNFPKVEEKHDPFKIDVNVDTTETEIIM